MDELNYEMESLDYWRLCDELTIVQAALLIVGEDPAVKQDYVLNWNPENRPRGFDAAYAALKHAVTGNRLKATIRLVGRNERAYRKEIAFGDDLNGKKVAFLDVPDWEETTIAVDDLRDWLRGRGLRPAFFFPPTIDTPDYLDPNHANYAPKLAAAISVWKTVTADPALMRACTAKQAMVKWLRLNGDRYGLTKDDGNPNEQGIEEVAKIANWDAKGGAPKTPVG